ncbi:MAG TPA: hypothetical protein VFZ91_07910 [Allosphingosinicella sp.]
MRAVVKKLLPSLLGLIGALILFAGQTGPDQALANLGAWLDRIGLGAATRWVWTSGLAVWSTLAGIALIGAAIALWGRKRRRPPPSPVPAAVPAPAGPAQPAPPPDAHANPLLLQIDLLIDRLERATEAYARDPEGFFKLPKYAKLRVQAKELDDLAEAVKLAVRRKYGEASEEARLATSAVEEFGQWRSPSDDDLFRNYIDWMIRVRGVATLLGP